jgi:hypothetical protein
MNVEAHIQELHNFWRSDHEEIVAEIRGWAADAAAAGHHDAERRLLEEIDRLEAIPKPWEPKPPPA